VEARKTFRPARELLTAVEADLVELSQQTRERRSPDLAAALREARNLILRNESRGRAGWPTGIHALDEVTGGLVEGQVAVVGGYTSVGKSTFLVGGTSAVAEAGGRVAFFSTEMRRDRIALRFIARLTEIPVLRLLRGAYPPDLAAKVRHAEETLSRWPVLLYDDARTLREIRLRCRKAKLHGGLAVAIVDFVQNLQGEGTLYERMSRTALEAQELAISLDCAVVLASQVSNEFVRASSDSPLLGYKGAGELAAAADVGLLLVPEREGTNEDLRLEIRKGRDSGKGHLRLRFAGNWTRLEES
jgi:replicative DNA helicase